MVIWFTLSGSITNITEEFSALDLIGTFIIVIGVIALAIVEKRISENLVDFPCRSGLVDWSGVHGIWLRRREYGRISEFGRI